MDRLDRTRPRAQRRRVDPLACAVRGCFAQDDQSVANAAGATVRADINANLQALVTNSSGAAAPGTTWAYMWWADTTTGLLKQRNAANSAWISKGTLASAFGVVDVDLLLSATKKAYLDGGGDTYLIENSANDVSLVVGGAERIGVDSGGILYLNDAARAVAAGNVRVKQTDGTVSMRIQNTHATTPDGLSIYFSGGAPDNNTQYFLKGEDNAAARVYIYSDGDLQNHDNSYGAISDERVKQDIVPARSQREDVKALARGAIYWRDQRDVAKYGDASKTMLGLGAQTVERTSPGLVTEHPEIEWYDEQVLDPETRTPLIGVTRRKERPTGRMLKGVQYSLAYMKGFIALGEALEDLDTIKARLAAAGIA